MNLYVSSNGSGDGLTVNTPMGFQQAIGAGSPAQPGDTIWMAEGLYSGIFTSEISGTIDNPIHIRIPQGSNVTIDGVGSGNVLTINGSDTWWHFDDSDVTSSDSDTTTNVRTGVNIYGVRTKWIDGWVHDHAGNGIGWWTQAEDSEVAGSMVVKNGRGTSGSHPHGIYAQNLNGIKHLTSVVIIDSWDFDLHLYGEQGCEVGWRIDGLISGGAPEGVIIGAGLTNDNIEITNCAHLGMRIGYHNAGNHHFKFSHNYGGIIATHNWESMEVTDNVAIGSPEYCVILDPIPGQSVIWDRNKYYYFDLTGGGGPLDGTDFAGWQAQGYDLNGSATAGRPPNHVVVKTHPYTPYRGLIGIFNWEKLDHVSVDLSSVGFSAGQGWTLASCSAPRVPILSGRYDGNPIVVPVSAAKTLSTFIVKATYDVVLPPPDNPPVVVVTASTVSGVVPCKVTFDWSGSSDIDVSPIDSYLVNFGDGNVVPLPKETTSINHTYMAAGVYNASVTATDSAGYSAGAVVKVEVKMPAPYSVKLTDAQIQAIIDAEVPLLRARLKAMQWSTPVLSQLTSAQITAILTAEKPVIEKVNNVANSPLATPALKTINMPI